MRNSKPYTAILFAIVTMSALILFVDTNSDAKADAIWTVGSQISQVAASGDNVYALWQNNSPDQNVYFRRSTDNGAAFDKTIRLSNAVSAGYATDPKMAVSGNYVYVAWMDAVAGENSKVLFRRSTDGGATFEDAGVLGNNAKGSSGIQQLLSSGNDVYAVLIDEWAEKGSYYYDVKLRVSSDNGKTFGDPISLLPRLSHWNVRSVSSLAASPAGDMLYLVGVDYGDCSPEQANCGDDAKIFFRKSADSGKNFSEPMTIGRPSGIVTKSTSEIRAQPPAWVQVAADNNHVSIVWGEYVFSEDRGAIFLAMSSDKGETFEDAVQLDGDVAGSSDAPLLFSSSDSTYVAWNAREDDKSAPHVALVRINSDGSFSRPVSATGKSSVSIWDVAVSGKNVYVAGSNSTKNISGLPEGVDVYFSASMDGGDSFGKPVNISDDNAIKTLLAAQQKRLSFVNPMLAASGKHVYVGWQTSYPDSQEIFIRASEDGGRTFGRITSLNEETGEPVSAGLSILTSSSAIYVIVIVSAIAAGAFGILVAKRRGGMK